MAERNPIVLSSSGELEQLPTGDVVPEGGFTYITRGIDAITLTNNNLAGRVLMETTGTSAKTITVPAGLVNLQPILVIQKGLGVCSFVAGAGVTINSPDGMLQLRTRYSSAQLIPMGSDVYYLIGDLA